MSRLTEWKNGELLVKEEERLLNTNGMITKDEMYKIMRHLAEKLADYEDKEEQGLLIELPCKVGDTVYRIWTCGKSGKSIAEFKIEHVDIDNYPQIEVSYRCTKGSHSFYPYRFCKIEDIGKTIFLTRSEAEEALAKMGGK